MSPEVGLKWVNLALRRHHEAPKTRPVWVCLWVHRRCWCICQIPVCVNSCTLAYCQAATPPNGCKGPPAHEGEGLKRLQKFTSALRASDL